MTRLRWNGPTDLEICIMSARSAQRTRRRRWRMGRDIASEREMRRTHGRRVSGFEALVVEGEQRRLLLLNSKSYDVRKVKIRAPAATKSYILDADYERHRNLYCLDEAVLERKHLPGPRTASSRLYRFSVLAQSSTECRCWTTSDSLVQHPADRDKRLHDPRLPSARSKQSARAC